MKDIYYIPDKRASSLPGSSPFFEKMEKHHRISVLVVRAFFKFHLYVFIAFAVDFFRPDLFASVFHKPGNVDHSDEIPYSVYYQTDAKVDQKNILSFSKGIEKCDNACGYHNACSSCLRPPDLRSESGQLKGILKLENSSDKKNYRKNEGYHSGKEIGENDYINAEADKRAALHKGKGSEHFLAFDIEVFKYLEYSPD